MYTYEIRQGACPAVPVLCDLEGRIHVRPHVPYAGRGLISARQVTVGRRRVRMYYHLEEPGRMYLLYAADRFREIFRLTAALLDGDGT